MSVVDEIAIMSDGNNGSSSSKRIKAVENAFEIIEALQELDGCGVRELAAHMAIPKSTAHIYLKTLADVGYVVRRDGKYRLSYRFLEIGGRIRHRNGTYQAAREQIDELAQEADEVATIGIEESGYRVMLYRSEPSGGLFNNAPTGEYTLMHWTAVGKALLSQKSAEEIGAIVDRHGLPRATAETITDRDELLGEIESTRERGYSVEDGERVEGVRAVAVPIRSDGSAGMAISVAGPAHEFDPERIHSELLPALQNAANVVELVTQHY